MLLHGLSLICCEASGQFPAAKQLADSIAKSPTAEIATMQGLLKKM